MLSTDAQIQARHVARLSGDTSSRPSWGERNSSDERTPKHRGHASVLNALRNSKRKVVVHKANGEVVLGEVFAFDEYTVTILDDKDGARRLLFKHAIDEITPVEDAKHAQQ